MNTTQDITLIIADDHPALCEGFASLFENCGIRVVDMAFDGEQLVEKVRQHRPDVVLADVMMPVIDGPAATKIIKQEFPQTRIIAFSAYDELGLIEEMNEAGAEGYVVKNIQVEELHSAIKKVHGGDYYYCSSAAKRLAKRKIEVLPPTASLSPKELEVLKLMCRGYSNKEIAGQLNIHSRTVEFHRANVYKKTGTGNPAHLAIYAVKHKLIGGKYHE